uniref:Uncharacterized protein n=1 Tax=Arundo donax TaxID=35708 RepID=A0A0A9DLI2_ARUDO
MGTGELASATVVSISQSIMKASYFYFLGTANILPLVRSVSLIWLDY